MIQTVTRSFTDDEREEVERQLLDFVSETPYRGMPHPLWGAFAGFIVGAILAMVAMLIFEASDLWGAALLSASTLAGGALAWRSHRQSGIAFRNSRRQYAATLAKRLQRGEIEEIAVAASGVVRVVLEDEHISACFFDIGDRKVLHLREETLWDAAEEAGPDERDAEWFLPSAFRMTRYPDAPDGILQLKALGPLLNPLRTIQVESVGEEFYNLEEAEVIEGVLLATIETDLPCLRPQG